MKSHVKPSRKTTHARTRRRHPPYLDEHTWSRSELMRARARPASLTVARHQRATPTSMAR